MSVSSHLNPEPERRLWIIHESVTRYAEWTDVKLAVLAFFCALEMPVILGVFREGPLTLAAVGMLCLALPLALAGLSPLADIYRTLPLLDQKVGRMDPSDSFLVARDLARYPHMELVNRLDRYLGGGITATRYYEDIVARIISASRSASRKRRLFAVACAPAVAAQFALALRLFLR
jgi:hypothetical protein